LRGKQKLFVAPLDYAIRLVRLLAGAKCDTLKIMDFLRNILSSILILLAIPSLLVATLSLTAQRTVLSEQFVRQQIEESRLYEGATALVRSLLKEQAQVKLLEPIIDRVITTQRVEEAIEPALGRLFAYLKSQTNDPTIVIDLRPIKGDVKNFLPPAEQRKIDEQMPNELTFGEISQEDAGGSRLERWRGWYERIQKWSERLPFVVAGLLVLLVLVNQGRSRLRRPAYVFLVVGMVLAAVGGLTTFGLPFALGRLGDIPNLPQLAKTSVDNLARNVGSDISNTIFVFGGTYLILAFLLFVASFFIHATSPTATGLNEKATDLKRSAIKR
jgi:hypothetical protein